MIRRPFPPSVPRARLGLLVAAGIAGCVAVAGAVAPGVAETAAVAPSALADRLEPRTWALAIPLSWLAAPLTGLREGDVLDLIGTRTSERASATEVAAGLRVMSIDDRALVVELTGADASAIAAARARGLTFVPILRSSR